MTHLREIVEKSKDVAGGFGEPVPLTSFGLSREDTEQMFSVYDEDYHISRFFHFSQTTGTLFQINGFPQTHVSIDAEIQGIL